MTKSLSRKQIDAFYRDGFYAPNDALSPDDADALRSKLEAFERSLGPGPFAPMYRRRLHAMLPWMRDLVEHPRVLDAVESLIGPDILVFTSTFFVKEPSSETITAWHQDALYLGLNEEHISAWVAFSDASELAGCMRFVLGSHNRGLLKHENRSAANSLNVVSQAIPETYADDEVRAAPLRRGQFSLHHTLVVHASEPNRSNDRRIGVSISYIPTRVKHRGSYRLPATLVRGEDRYGHYDLEPDPRTMAAELARTAHANAFARYRQAYDEQLRNVGVNR
jgi:non-haem Fe2+, alpha-ketoglutarate-dependent halogenase